MDDAPDTPPPTLVQKLSAEAVGTFALVFFGLGAIALTVAQALQAYSGEDYGPDLAQLASGNGFSLALAFGLTLTGLGFALHRVSGAHLNPAVSLGSAAAGRMSWVEAAQYCGAQLLGAILGGAVLLLVLQGFDVVDAFDYPIAVSSFGDDGTGLTLWAVLVLELVVTFFFVLAFLGAHDERNPLALLAPLAVGFAFAGVYFATGSADGGGANPARSIASNLFSGGDPLKQLWVFLVIPLIAGVLAGAVYPVLFGRGSAAVAGSGFTAPAKSAPAGYPGAQGGAPWQQGGYPGQPGTPGQPGPAGGYGGAPSPQSPQSAQPPAEQPIIQDGWQWDPQAQQWIPAQPQPGAGGWDQGGSTQIRPGGPA